MLGILQDIAQFRKLMYFDLFQLLGRLLKYYLSSTFCRSVPGIFAANADTVAQTSNIPNGSTIASSTISTTTSPSLPIARKSRPLDRRLQDDLS